MTGMPETDRLASWLISAGYEEYFNLLGPFYAAGDEYDIASEDEYKSLGENPNADDLPLVLVRKSDGAMFEIDFDVYVKQVTPEQKQAEREYFLKMRERGAIKDGGRSPVTADGVLPDDVYDRLMAAAGESR